MCRYRLEEAVRNEGVDSLADVPKNKPVGDALLENRLAGSKWNSESLTVTVSVFDQSAAFTRDWISCT